MLSAASLAAIVQGIQLAISAAQYAAPVVAAAKGLITELFNSGVITIDQQNTVHTYCDALQAAALNNQEPPAWIVEADPV